MQVKMKTVARGADFNADPGQTVPVSDDFGQALIDGGYAELVGEAPASKRRKAVAGPAETREAPAPEAETPAPEPEPAPEAEPAAAADPA
ncbi:MAG: hypothetical protein JF588_11450 [Caulobacterales bacterium]|nr:hypothetical protein [Caulobacterales bacterium]